jgi:hypothetical protein
MPVSESGFHGSQRGAEACQIGLSRLLGADWPRTLDELEELRRH